MDHRLRAVARTRTRYKGWMPTKKRPVTKSGRPRKRKGVDIEPTQLAPKELRLDPPPPEVAELARAIEDDGGAVLAIYREPLGGNALLFAALPVEKVERTAFQRDVSDAHVRKLTLAMDKTRATSTRSSPCARTASTSRPTAAIASPP